MGQRFGRSLAGQFWLGNLMSFYLKHWPRIDWGYKIHFQSGSLTWQVRRASWEWQASVSLNLSPSISCLSVLKTRLLDPPEWSRRKKAKCVARPSMTWFWKSYTVHSTPFSLLEVSHYFAAHISGEEIYPSPWEGRIAKNLWDAFLKVPPTLW